MAGGQGTRLRPLTLLKPKPMVTLLGRPVIDFIGKALHNAGVSELIVTTGYRGDQLIEKTQSWSQHFGIPSRVNQESTPMGTAGSVRLLSEEITSTCVIGSGDSVASYDIRPLLECHRTSGAKVTMALWDVNNPTEYGIVGLSSTHDGELQSNLSEGYIRKFAEKPKLEDAFSTLINAGLYVIEPEVIDLIPADTKYDFSKDLFPRLLEMNWPMYAKKVEGLWFDVGHPEELLKAQSALLSSPRHLPFSLPEGTRYGDTCYSVSPVQEGQVERCYVDEDCNIHPSSFIKDSYIMRSSVIEQDVTIINSIIGEGCTIQSNTLIENCIIGDGTVIAPHCRHVDQKIPSE